MLEVNPGKKNLKSSLRGFHWHPASVFHTTRHTKYFQGNGRQWEVWLCVLYATRTIGDV